MRVSQHDLQHNLILPPNEKKQATQTISMYIKISWILGKLQTEQHSKTLGAMLQRNGSLRECRKCYHGAFFVISSILWFTESATPLAALSTEWMTSRAALEMISILVPNAAALAFKTELPLSAEALLPDPCAFSSPCVLLEVELPCLDILVLCGMIIVSCRQQPYQLCQRAKCVCVQ